VPDGADPGGVADEVLTVEEAARRYGFAPRRLRSRVAMGGFPGAFEVQTDAGSAWLVPVRAFAALGYRPVGNAPQAVARSEVLQASQDTASRPPREVAERPGRDRRLVAPEGSRRRSLPADLEANGQHVAGPRPARRRRLPLDRAELEEQFRLMADALEHLRGSLLDQGRSRRPPR